MATLPRSTPLSHRPVFPQFPHEIRFRSTGREFSGLFAAQQWLADHGYAYGPIERDQPIGLWHGDAKVYKWTTLSSAVRALLDGVIDIETEELGFRHGPAIVKLRKEPPRVAPPSSRRSDALGAPVLGAAALGGSR